MPVLIDLQTISPDKGRQALTISPSQVYFLNRLKGNHVTDYRFMNMNPYEPPHPKHFPEVCSLSLVSVCVFSYSWLAVDENSLHPQVTERQKAQSEFAWMESRLKAFGRLSFPPKISVTSTIFIWWYSAFLASRAGESLSPALSAQHSCREHRYPQSW